MLEGRRPLGPLRVFAAPAPALRGSPFPPKQPRTPRGATLTAPGRRPARNPGAPHLTSAFTLGPLGLVVRLLGPEGGRFGALRPRRLLLAPLAPQPVEGAAEAGRAGAGLLSARGAARAPRLVCRRCGGGLAGSHGAARGPGGWSGPLRRGAHALGRRAAAAGDAPGEKFGRRRPSERARSGRREGRRAAGGGRGAGPLGGKEPGEGAAAGRERRCRLPLPATRGPAATAWALLG